ncbi:acetyltransferase [Fictibacillus sp. WQ 8-8]|uniref:GNAT family N-acetyltransferase n=1 Tax=Fictibacillus sp. WQ 8-8 TaxID=2938788 RepID=UPI00210B90CD|nr:GNAT family N-acetyltransferase [Fictibacillus sp. WQ 8-8]MCQ6265161.1 acetyltransferase [Fictibacillus sp. WQ 8-8]
MFFQNGKLSVRQLAYEDRFVLAKWLSDPSVLEFYEGRDRPHDIYKVIQKFFKKEDETVGCIVEYDGIDIGYIQFYKLDVEAKHAYGYRDETVYGMDQFLGEARYRDRGIGTDLVAGMLEYLVSDKQAQVIIMDPQTWNKRAIRCYEKCGFKKVKVLAEHEWHEGKYRDCWLIEFRPDKEEVS